MKIVPSLLLLLVVAAEPGSSHTSALTLPQLCRHAFRVLNNDTFVTTEISHPSKYLYVRPEPGFQGFSLTALTSDGEQYSAFFPKQDECFQDQADWWQVFVETWPDNYTPNSINHHGLYFRVWISGCHRLCHYPATADKIARVMITIYGPSAWKTTSPDSRCKIIMITDGHEEEGVPCKTYTSPTSDNTATTGPAGTKSPATTTPTTNTTTTSPGTTTASSLTTFFTDNLRDSFVVVVVVPGIAVTVVTAGSVRLVVFVQALLKKRRTSRQTVHQLS